MNAIQGQPDVPSEVKSRTMQEKSAGEDFSIVIELDEAQQRQVAGGKFIKIGW